MNGEDRDPGFIHPTHKIPTEAECETAGGGFCAKCQWHGMAKCAWCKLSIPDLNEPCMPGTTIRSLGGS